VLRLADMLRRHRTVLALAAVTLLSRAVATALLCFGFSRYNRIAFDLAGDVGNWFMFIFDSRYFGTPYIELRREYPVGAGLLYMLLTPVWKFVETEPWEFLAWHGALMAVADVANTVLFYDLVRRVSPQRAVALTLLFALNLTALVLSPVRYESWMVTTVLVGLREARRGRLVATAVALSLGAWLKWFPLLLVPAAKTESDRVSTRHGWPDVVVVFALVSFALNVPFMLVGWERTGGIDGWLATYRFHMNRELYPDTVLGVAQMWLGPLPIERWASVWSLALVIAGIVWGWSRGVVRTGVVVCVATLALNRVYSPQFHLWFYPLLLLLAAEVESQDYRRLLGTFVLLDLLNVLIFPLIFHHTLIELGSWRPVPAVRAAYWAVAFTLAIVLRSIVIGLLGVMVLRLPPPRPEASPAS
jgi:hypothetical protein